jgi:dipeptidyl aminopeptidase/acylaminoacyl peptidase
MRPTDIELLHSVSLPTVQAGASRAVVSVSHPSLSADATVGQLWSIPLDGGQPRRISRGFRDSAPKFSPDGAALAFIRSAPKQPGQLYVMPSDGGEPTQLTDAKLGVDEFTWSHDSTSIAFVAAVPEQGRYGTVEDIGSSAEPARRITDHRYKMNGRGYTNDQRTHVFLVEVPALDAEPPYPPVAQLDGEKPEAVVVPKATQLTDGDVDDHSLRFLPGDDRIAFVSNERDGVADLQSQVWAVPVGGGAVEQVTKREWALSVDRFEVDVEGRLLLSAAEVGETGFDFVARNAGLVRVDAAGERIEWLTDPATVDLTDYPIETGADGALSINRMFGTSRLIGIGWDGASAELTPPELEVTGFAGAEDDVVVAFQSATSFGDVGILRDGEFTVLTDFSATIRDAGIVEPAAFEATGRDGYPIHGWVAKPAGDGPHPTLLMIHGGPYAQYSIHLFDETQVYVDAGYAVVYCNPRGSAGYGREHGLAIREKMGTVDLYDVLDFLDGALAADPDLDASRLGILGGSYGGYLTAWTIAHDHRFKAAIVERGFLDPDAFIGSSDIGWFFPQEYNGATGELRRTQSPQAVAHQVTTPTLVIHSEDDLRCPIGQAETYWATLKLQGVDAELLVFPGENHELTRSGRPRHRVQRFEAVIEWFGRYL